MRDKCLRLLPALLAALLVLAVTCFTGWRALASRGPAAAARAYVSALAAGDAGAAKNASTGSAAAAASRLEGRGLSAAVSSVEVHIAALGRGWALAEAAVELLLPDGAADAGWYALELAKGPDGRWRAASFRESSSGAPCPGGVTLPVTGSAVRGAEAVFKGYVDALAAGDWQGAARFLAGPARAAHESSAAALGKGAPFGTVEGLASKGLYRRGKLLVVEHRYALDGRDVVVAARYWKTSQGWKITGITQSGPAG